MRRKIPKASYFLDGYNVFMQTTDKKFASVVFKYLGRTVAKLEETARDIDAEYITHDTDDTSFFTSDKALALLVLQYIKKTTKDPIDETIKRLEKQVK